MKKSTIAILIVITVLFSGVAGFGGALLADQIHSAIPQIAEKLFAPATGVNYNDNTASSIDKSQDNGYTNPLITSDNTPRETPVLITAGDKPKTRELTIPEIAALASGSVVEIYTESVTNGGRMGQFVSEGAGSGVIISTDGYIVTNNHVIDGSRKITVRLNNGTDYEAALIGRDSKTDIAVLKIDATGLSPVTFGDSDALVVGELAVAIGNPLGELGGTVTEGVISALSRNIEIDGNMMTLLQTSAAVNPGNSGGGLFNSYGELIGVVNAKSSGSDIEGIGFAIPAKLAATIAESLIEYGYIPGRIDFGATLINIHDQMTAMMYRVQTAGVYVAQAEQGGALQAGDRIISVDDVMVMSVSDVEKLLENHTAGDVLSITVARSGSTTTVEHTLKQATS